jgi:hypothetical protein
MPGVTTAYQNGIHSARPAASAGCILYACSTHSLIYRSDGSAWTTWMTIGSTTTTVASDAIWDAAGDLAVGSGADTAVKLAIGAAGGALSVINSAVAWNSGTSFPGSKATGDRYWRTDLALEFYWDGTRWLTTQLFHDPLASSDVVLPVAAGSSPSTVGRATIKATSALDLWLIAFETVTAVFTTNNGSNYWTTELFKVNAANTATSVVSNNSSADTVSNWVSKSTAIGASIDLATYKEIETRVTKTGTPGIIYAATAVSYRLIGT